MSQPHLKNQPSQSQCIAWSSALYDSDGDMQSSGNLWALYAYLFLFQFITMLKQLADGKVIFLSFTWSFFLNRHSLSLMSFRPHLHSFALSHSFKNRCINVNKHDRKWLLQPRNQIQFLVPSVETKYSSWFPEKVYKINQQCGGKFLSWEAQCQVHERDIWQPVINLSTI